MVLTSTTIESTVGDVLKAVGAWRTGHFLLTSGLHSDQYMQCQRVMQYPQFGDLLADLLVEKLAEINVKPEVVVGPALGAVHWEVFVASALERKALLENSRSSLAGLLQRPEDTYKAVEQAIRPESINSMVKAVFAERAGGSDEFSIRRGIELDPGTKVLVVEDVTTTGGSAKKVVELISSLGAKPIAVAAIVDRSGGKAQFDVPFVSLLKLNLATFQPEECPLCKSGSSAEKPGSSKK
ncbi:MAG: orotate phosphoribosyltransferase [Candidatus Obscuribacterales bacterium]|nr:orotate phosphoribosyltransferase [Candidatus Obscuribacterales bacterium]